MATVEEKKNLYQKIEQITGNPLIVFATSRRPSASGSIASDSVDEFIRQVDLIEESPNIIDVLIESNGGDPLVIWRLVSILRTKAKKIRALVPHSAFSAATLFCMGADEIIMGRYANLGPTDPQITVMGKDGNQKNFAFEDVLAFIHLVRRKFGLSGSKAKEIINRLFDSVEPFSLGFASRSSFLALSMGTKLLETHKDGEAGKLKSWVDRWHAKRISSKLGKSFFSHSHPVNKAEALDIGLNVTEPSEELASLMWKVHLCLDAEFENQKPFDTLTNYLQNNPPLNMGGATLPLGEYEFELKFVVVESSRFLNDYRVKYRTTVYRDQNANYHSTNAALSQGWSN